MELAQAYEGTGETDLALEVLTDAARLSGGNSKAISLSGYILAKKRAGERSARNTEKAGSRRRGAVRAAVCDGARAFNALLSRCGFTQKTTTVIH